MKTQHSLSIVKEFWYFSSKWCKAMWSCLTIIKYQCSRGMDKEKTILYIPLTTKSYNIFYVKSICGEKNPTGNLSRIQNNISLPEEISFMRILHLQIGKKNPNPKHFIFKYCMHTPSKNSKIWDEQGAHKAYQWDLLDFLSIRNLK